MDRAQEEELLLKLRNNSGEAFSLIYESYSKTVCMVAYIILQDLNEAENVMQDVFISLWQRRNWLDCTWQLRNYLMISAKNKSIDLKRRKKYHETYIADSLNQASETDYDPKKDKEEMLKNIYMELNKIKPPIVGQAFRMIHLEGHTHREIAQQLGITEQSSRTYVWKATQFLKEKLKKRF